MLLSSLATSIYARITFVLGLCAWGIPTAVGFSQMTSCRLQSNYSSMVAAHRNNHRHRVKFFCWHNYFHASQTCEV